MQVALSLLCKTKRAVPRLEPPLEANNIEQLDAAKILLQNLTALQVGRSRCLPVTCSDEDTLKYQGILSAVLRICHRCSSQAATHNFESGS